MLLWMFTPSLVYCCCLIVTHLLPRCQVCVWDLEAEGSAVRGEYV